MTKPADIPQDVWDASEPLAEGVLMYADFHSVVRANNAYEAARTTVSRAILAERERCAKFADLRATDPEPDDVYGDEDSEINARVVAQSIAAAIRQPA